MKKPVIQIFALGGTIAMTPDATASGVHPSLSADDLVAAVPGIESLAELRAETLARIGSVNLTYPHIKRLIEAAKSSDADGFVVTQGTDAMEESAFLASLFWRDKRPLVFTGAMRNPTSLGADGPANLADSMRVAVAGKSGVYLVMNGEIHDPCRVRKGHTSSLGAFVSAGGALGTLVEGLAHFNQSLVRHTFPQLPDKLPPVALLTAAFDDDGYLLDSLCGETAYKGVVIEATGGGHISEIWTDKVEQLALKMPVVMASRTGAGRVLKNTYGYKGAEIDLIKKGVVTSGRLDGLKARLVLQVCLASDEGYKQIFDELSDLA